MEELNLERANGVDLLNWFSAGAEAVATQRKYLNDINVFPVADGDTGTNLYTTLRAMVENPQRERSFADMLRGISMSGLESARGNSGIIFASFINGIAQECQPTESVDVAEFSGIAYRAVKHLYAAVEHPAEGTLMSVIRDWAQYLETNKGRFSNFRELFFSAYQSAMVSLEKTKEQLQVLRKHNVVDSGAAGFVRFLHGINLTFSRERAVKEEDAPVTLPIFGEDGETEFRFCTEALLDTSGAAAAGKAIVPEQIKAELAPFGDSLILNNSENRLKVHIHTNTPELVHGTAEELWRVSGAEGRRYGGSEPHPHDGAPRNRATDGFDCGHSGFV